MSASTFKSGLSVGATASKLMRRPTPDSEAVASSDDDRDHVVPARPAGNPLYTGGRRPSSGWLQDIQPNRKYSLPSVSFAGSQPTTPSLELSGQARPSTSSFPWNTSSFTSTPSNTRFKEVLPSPTSAHGPGDKAFPSPSTIEADDGIGFLLSQQHAVRKSVRSQSYSVGQGEIDNQASRLRSSLRHRPSKPSLLGEPTVGLAQLREDDIDEIESSNGSEGGTRLPAGYWEQEHKQKQQALLKQAAMENARARTRGVSSESQGPPTSQRKTPQSIRSAYQNDHSIDDSTDTQGNTETPTMTLTRRFSEQVGSFEDAYSYSGDSKGWQGGAHRLNADLMSRRHSIAHYGSQMPTFQTPTLGNTQEEDEEETSPHQRSASPVAQPEFEYRAYFSGFGPASKALNASAISTAHPDPAPPPPHPASNPYAVPPAFGRPGRRLFVVTFKCSRAELYYLYENTGLEIRRGDLVIVEGDRGADLGQVTQADVSLEDAKKFKNEANEEHFRWLVMFSQYSMAGNSTDSSMLGALARAHGLPNATSRPQITPMGAQVDQETKPKMIKRLAQQHEIMGLRDKEGQEAKAKRVGASKAAEHNLPMEILDAEYQAYVFLTAQLPPTNMSRDYHKLTYYYYAEAYVNFNDLVTDLFKQYKVRIWMSAVNPASVVNPAGLMQITPPSAIGPGAIIHSNPTNASLSVGTGFGNSSYRSNEQTGT